ncbi:hypothetical protein GOP47_0011578 [Adiantum capillus-veneris]|uniref:chlorophyll(ide) b reductase n=1 Tax=Adiantum capillus-veneris TaxID=13818 RepID=A0A9D4UTK0_ADICA|nr:hypothetical protein GOP47_0011578 [Adiantum capillus-veneris]
MAGASLHESFKHASSCSWNPLSTRILSLTPPRAEIIRNCFCKALSATRTKDPFLLNVQHTKNPFLSSTQVEGRTRRVPLFHTCATSSQATTLSDPVVPIAPQARTPPFHVLITGSTKGIGYALARKFLQEGDKVIICSRSGENVDKAVENLTQEFGEQRAYGIPADVRNGESVQKLISFAKEKLGYIDVWINNAGSNAYTYKPLVETNDEMIMEIVETNTIGVMICCREAIKMMMSQDRGGHIFNMDGAGADGRPTPRFAAYGATKRSLLQLTKSLQAELKMQRIKSVVIHMLSPGMVTTDLLMSGSDTPQAKFFINVLAEPADMVAEFLVPRVRALLENGMTKPTYIRFLTGFKAYSQILSRLLFNARKNRYLQEEEQQSGASSSTTLLKRAST